MSSSWSGGAKGDTEPAMKLGSPLHMVGLTLLDTIAVWVSIGVAPLFKTGNRERFTVHRRGPNNVAFDETVIEVNDGRRCSLYHQC